MKKTYIRGSILFCILLMFLPGAGDSDETPTGIDMLRWQVVTS
jgi:hypothetical protein